MGYRRAEDAIKDLSCTEMPQLSHPDASTCMYLSRPAGGSHLHTSVGEGKKQKFLHEGTVNEVSCEEFKEFYELFLYDKQSFLILGQSDENLSDATRFLKPCLKSEAFADSGKARRPC